MGTAILLIYLAGCMGFLIPTARFFLNDDFGSADSGDYVGAAAMSLVTVWFFGGETVGPVVAAFGQMRPPQRLLVQISRAGAAQV